MSRSSKQPSQAEGRKDPCMLPESQRQCAGGVGYEDICRKCGWFEPEYRRRRTLPIEEGENGLRVRNVGKQPEKNQI